jgi:Fe-S-cluster containining protein
VSRALQLADFQSFECHSCGRCCRNSWAVRVEPSAREAIATSRSAQAVRRQGYRPLLVQGAEQSVVTGRRSDGACVFLSADDLCSLHAELGAGRKPLACQLYPYSITATPEGDFVSLSFACPAVVQGRGGDLESNRRELQDLLSERSPALEVPQSVEVVQGRFVPWGCYRELEERLGLAFDPSDPAGSLLDAAVSVLLTLKAAPAGQAPQWGDLRAVQREEGFEESALAMICASVIALWELPNDPLGRQAFSMAILAGEPQTSSRHGASLHPFQFATPEPAFRTVFARYFANALHGKSLLVAPLVSRILTLVGGFLLVMYYETVFRRREGAPEPTSTSLARAFELVEADLVTHTRSVDPLFLTLESMLGQSHGLACE